MKYTHIIIIILALLTGLVKTTAETRLINMTGEDAGTARNDEDDVENVKISTMAIINATIMEEGLLKLRTNMDNLDLFQSFVNYCLIHFTTSMNWRYKACNTCISEIFTETDEALCILLLENNAGDYKKTYNE